MVMAVLPVAAHAQLTSAEYTVNTGEMRLNFEIPYDSLSILLSRIQVTDGTENVTASFNDFVRARTGVLYLNMDAEKMNIINNMSNPILVMNEGAVQFGGVNNVAQSVPLTGIIQVGAVIPKGNEEILSVAELSVDHFNHVLEQNDALWRLEMVLKDYDDQILSLLELQQENIHVAIGTESLLAKNRIAQLGMTVIACCATHTDYDIVHADALSFAMIPDDDHALEATIALMNERGVNRILPVYPADDLHVLDRIDHIAQVAVAEGIQYNLLHSGEDIASFVSNAVVSDLISVPDIRLGVLLTDTDDVPRILEAASKDRSLTRVMWFGQSQNNDILNNPNATSFAQEVDYSVPHPSGLENPVTVSLDSHLYNTLDRVPDPITFGAYDVVQIVGLAILGDADIHKSAVDTFGSLNFAAEDVASAIPEISGAYGGYTTYTGLDESGGLTAPVYQIQTIRDDDWVRIGMYNNPRYTSGGAISFGDIILPHTQYTAGEPLVHDVVPVGLLVHEYDDHAAGLAARMGLALMNTEYTLIVNDVTNDDIEFSMNLFNDVDVPIVLVHAPELSMLEASQHAQNNDMLVIGTASTTRIFATPNDDTFRMLPSDVWQAKALAGIMQYDNIQGVVAIYPDSPEVRLLLEDVATEFTGEVDMTHSYDDVNNVMRDAAASIRSMADKYGTEGTAILVMAGDDTADIINAARGTAKQVNWYGSLGIAGSQKIQNEATDTVNLAVISPAMSDGGPAQIILDSLSGTQLPMYSASLFEAARLAGVTMTESDSNPSIARAILPSIADGAGLIFDHTTLDENGDLASNAYDIWRLDDDMWTRDSAYDATSGYTTKIPIGVITPLTGSDTQRGIQQMWGAHLAISAQNDMLKQDGIPWRLSQRVVDTATAPNMALDAARTLYDSNIQVALGPPDTASMDMIGEFGIDNDFAVVSCCSDTLNVNHTGTTSLGSTQIHQFLTIMRMLNDDQITSLLIIQSNNNTTDIILNNLVSNFNGLLNVQRYAANDTYSQIAANAESTISGMLNSYGSSSVGVFLLTHDDPTSILEAALRQNNLQYVNWYGLSVDGALPSILSSPDAVTTAGNTNFAVATPAIPQDVSELKSELQTSMGFTPSSDAYLMYDAATLLSTTIIRLNGNSAAPAVVEIMPLLAQDMVGITGLLAPDVNNQRLHISHDVWSIVGDEWRLQKTIP